MKKSDLKTEMKVVLRDGGEYMVLLNVEKCLNNDNILTPITTGRGWIGLDNYNDELECVNKSVNNSYDIVEIKTPDQACLLLTDCEWNTIWRKQTKKKMSISDIEKELGYEIEIVE